mmetsp:Transcript_19267/g.53566  ORF Transcript_19267/g.53566 Transcript_19267/m.53566 type:complete len:214 (+) Transcript_19267:741-1382(+)
MSGAHADTIEGAIATTEQGTCTCTCTAKRGRWHRDKRDAHRHAAGFDRHPVRPDDHIRHRPRHELHGGRLLGQGVLPLPESVAHHAQPIRDTAKLRVSPISHASNRRRTSAATAGAGQILFQRRGRHHLPPGPSRRQPPQTASHGCQSKAETLSGSRQPVVQHGSMLPPQGNLQLRPQGPKHQLPQGAAILRQSAQLPPRCLPQARQHNIGGG